MTTLPQTTPHRIARPAASTPLALPGAAPAGGLTQSTGFQLTPSDIWRIIRANLWLLIILLVAAGVAGHFIFKYLERHHSKYTATGLIQIQSLTNPNPLAKNKEVDVGPTVADMRTQVQLLQTEALISRTLQNPDRNRIRETRWWKRFPEREGSLSRATLAKRDLVKNLSVHAVADTRLIRISVTGPFKEDVAIIAEEIVQQHLDEQANLIHARQQDRSRVLTEMRVNYKTLLDQRTDEIKRMQAELGEAGTGFINNGAGGSVQGIELSKISVGRTQVQMNWARAEAALQKGLQELASGQDPPQVLAIVDSNPEVAEARKELRDIEFAMADTAEQFGENHPIIQRLRKRQELVTARLESVRGELLAKTRASYIEELKSQAADARAYLDQIDKRIDELRSEIADLSNKTARYLTLKDEQESYRVLLKQIEGQLEDIAALNSRELRTVAWVQKPQEPDTASYPKLPNIMGMSLMLALGLGLGIAFLRELLDTTVRSPRDITRIGQLNLLGMVPHENDDPQSAGARLPLVIFDAPHSIMAEQFRHIRTRLQHAASLDTTRTIMITAPSPKDGKTTVATNLAAGLALNGRKILLVDADFRRPELHRVFGFTNEVGFSNVLAGQAQFKDALKDSQIPNLSIMTSGPKPPNATELFESQLYNDFIERAAEEFDHVIFDSGPFLVVSESFAMAPRVDGVVTVVRAHKDSRGILTRMRDTLRQVKAEHLGIILNGVRAHGGGYYGRNIKTYYAYERGSE
jgi:succinoglycan biosynthesis transport protein ExoP